MADRGRQERPFLGDALNRLQRMLGVTGSASPQYDDGSKIVPVAIVGDGTLPGYGAQQLRRFIAALEGTNNAGNPTTVIIGATRDVIITRYWYSISAAASTQTIRYFGPSEVLPYAVTTPRGVWIDRAQAGAEAAPIVGAFDNTGIAAGGTILWRYDTQAAQVGNQIEALTSPFLLVQGAALQIHSTSVNIRFQVNVEGMAL